MRHVGKPFTIRREAAIIYVVDVVDDERRRGRVPRQKCQANVSARRRDRLMKQDVSAIRRPVGKISQVVHHHSFVVGAAIQRFHIEQVVTKSIGAKDDPLTVARPHWRQVVSRVERETRRRLSIEVADPDVGGVQHRVDAGDGDLTTVRRQAECGDLTRQ